MGKCERTSHDCGDSGEKNGLDVRNNALDVSECRDESLDLADCERHNCAGHGWDNCEDSIVHSRYDADEGALDGGDHGNGDILCHNGS